MADEPTETAPKAETKPEAKPELPERANYRLLQDHFGEKAGAIFSLSAAEANAAGGAVELVTNPRVLRWWGREPLVLD